MSVTPIGNTNFINQNAPVASSVHAKDQARFDMQNALAAELEKDKKDDGVHEVEATTKIYKIDPENQHEKHKRDDEQSAFDGEQELKANDNEDDTLHGDEGGQIHHLDIKI